MNVMLWLILASLAVAGGGLAVFMWSLRSGQYEDLKGAANRILFDD
jgi:cbb3-type cytochrome oxidase maturation protein